MKGDEHMIDFENAKFLKLRAVEGKAFASTLAPMFVQGEYIVQAFQTVRDGVVFTNRRIFAINVQGLVGKKKDFTILPYNRIQAFSIETAGVFDLDSELQLWFSGLGRVYFEFSSNANVTEICRLISENML